MGGTFIVSFPFSIPDRKECDLRCDRTVQVHVTLKATERGSGRNELKRKTMRPKLQRGTNERR